MTLKNQNFDRFFIQTKIWTKFDIKKQNLTKKTKF